MSEIPARAPFDEWWYNEGSGIIPGKKEDTSEFCERVAKIAWANGDFKAKEEAMELLRELPLYLHEDNPNDAGRSPAHCLCTQCCFIRRVRGFLTNMKGEQSHE